MKNEIRPYRDPVFDEVAAREARVIRQNEREAARLARETKIPHTLRWIKRLRIRSLTEQAMSRR